MSKDGNLVIDLAEHCQRLETERDALRADIARVAHESRRKTLEQMLAVLTDKRIAADPVAVIRNELTKLRSAGA
jgi:hypothetical protein